MSELVSTALVTGGSRGIGKAASLALGKAGYQVYLTFVSKPEEASGVAQAIIDAGGAAKAFRLDVSDSAAVKDFFAAEIKKKVQLDVLVNNAGITKDGLLMRMKDEDFDRVLDVNLKGAFYCIREAASVMAKQRAGRIVNIASVVGQMGNPGQANYVASKAGLIGMTKSVARELASRGVTCNAVTPGFIATDMTNVLTEEQLGEFLKNIPLGRPGTPDDVANAVAFLASDAAAYITGQVLSVNGGMYM